MTAPANDLATLKRKLAARRNVPGFQDSVREIEARIAALGGGAL